MTLKMTSRSPKSSQLLSLPQSHIDASLKIHPLVQKIFHIQDYDLENEVTKISQTCHSYIWMQVQRKSIHWFKRCATSKTMTLKMTSRSAKSNKFFSLSQRYIDTILKKTHPLVRKIFCL